MGSNYLGGLNWQAFRNPLFASCAFLYVSHSVCKRIVPAITEAELLHNYLNDFLFVPLALGIAVFLQRNFILKQPEYHLSKEQVMLCVAYISVMFEGVIPYFKTRYTADFFDVLCYSFGGLLFYFFGNSTTSKLPERN